MTGNSLVDARLEAKGVAKELSKDLDRWQRLLQSEEWKLVINYLQDRFIEVSDEDADSVKDLARRNGRLDEIKRLFRFIKHDYNSKQARLQQIFQERSIDGEDDPVPFVPY